MQSPFTVPESNVKHLKERAAPKKGDRQVRQEHRIDLEIEAIDVQKRGGHGMDPALTHPVYADDWPGLGLQYYTEFGRQLRWQQDTRCARIQQAQHCYRLLALVAEPDRYQREVGIGRQIIKRENFRNR